MQDVDKNILELKRGLNEETLADIRRYLVRFRIAFYYPLYFFLVKASYQFYVLIRWRKNLVDRWEGFCYASIVFGVIIFKYSWILSLYVLRFAYSYLSVGYEL